jgi:hypothetical protein
MLKNSSLLSKTNKFVLLGILTHIFITLYVSGFDHFFRTTQSYHTNEHLPPNPHLFSSLGDGHEIGNNHNSNKGDDNDDPFWEIDPIWSFNFFSILTIFLLYISLTLKFTWPVGIEQTLIIILLWMLIGNMFNSNVHCKPHHPHHHENETNITLIEEHTTTTGGLCQHWFSIIYSLLCISTAVFSYLSDIKHYVMSFIFCACSFISMTLIIFLYLYFIPMSCNHFQMDLTILILRITLYNTIWNMNRFMRFTETLLEDEYIACINLVSRCNITFTERDKYQKNKKKKRKKRRESSSSFSNSDEEEEDEGK